MNFAALSEDDGLDAVFDALANQHRRAIVHAVALQPCAISELARARHLSLPAINKHIGILERAAVIDRRKIGRTTFLVLKRGPLAQLQGWVDQFHPYWGSDDATYENYFNHLSRQGGAATNDLKGIAE